MSKGITQKPVVEQMIAELKSGFATTLSGPCKEINGIRLMSVEIEPAGESLRAEVAVEAYQQDIYGGSANTLRSFVLGLGDLQQLSETAPDFQSSFAGMARDLSGRLETARQEYQRDVTQWCEKGLPLQQQLRVKKPLRFMRP